MGRGGKYKNDKNLDALLINSFVFQGGRQGDKAVFESMQNCLTVFMALSAYWCWRSSYCRWGLYAQN